MGNSRVYWVDPRANRATTAVELAGTCRKHWLRFWHDLLRVRCGLIPAVPPDCFLDSHAKLVANPARASASDFSVAKEECYGFGRGHDLRNGAGAMRKRRRAGGETQSITLRDSVEKKQGVNRGAACPRKRETNIN